jgi:hypothetical protein
MLNGPDQPCWLCGGTGLIVDKEQHACAVCGEVSYRMPISLTLGSNFIVSSAYGEAAIEEAANLLREAVIAWLAEEPECDAT